MNTFFRQLFLFSLIIATVFFTFFVQSCSTDKCKATACAYGVCNNGVCKCLTGYSGPNCDTVCRDRFLAAWTVYEKGSATGTHIPYQLKIVQDTDVDKVVIYSLYNFFGAVRATIVHDSIIIPNQQLQGHVVQGVGHIYSSKAHPNYTAILMQYQVVDTATMERDDMGVYTYEDHSPASDWFKY